MMIKKKSSDNNHHADLLNLTEEFEIKHIMKTFGVPETKVKEAIRSVGSSREKIEAYLRKRSNDD